MCIICIELMKHHLTMLEAEKASNEMILTTTGTDAAHYRELNRSIREMDLETLGNVLEEGKEKV